MSIFRIFTITYAFNEIKILSWKNSLWQFCWAVPVLLLYCTYYLKDCFPVFRSPFEALSSRATSHPDKKEILRGVRCLRCKKKKDSTFPERVILPRKKKNRNFCRFSSDLCRSRSEFDSIGLLFSFAHGRRIDPKKFWIEMLFAANSVWEPGRQLLEEKQLA